MTVVQTGGAAGRAGARLCRVGTVALLLLALVPACSPSRDAPLRVGLPARVPMEFAFLARELGFFHDGEVDLVPYSSSIELSRHFRDGTLDAAALPLDFLPYWIPTLRSLDVVMVVDVSSGAAGVVAREGVADLDALREKRIGVESSPFGAHLLLHALAVAGMGLRDVKTVSVDPQDEVGAFVSKKVDAVVTWEPDRSALVAAGARSVFDTSRAPGRFVDVLVVPTALSGSRAAALRKLVSGWLTAFGLLELDRGSTVDYLVSRMGISRRAVESSLSGVRLGDLALNRGMLGPRPQLEGVLDEVRKTGRGAGLLRESAAGGVRFVDSFLPSMVSRPSRVLAAGGGR